MKRILTFLIMALCFSALLAMLSLSPLALGEEAGDPPSEAEEVGTPVGVCAGAAPAPAEETEREQNLFLLLFDEIGDRLPEIFSVLTLLSSLGVILGYRRGFLPLLRGGIGKLSEAVHDLGEETKAHRDSADGLVAGVTTRLEKTESVLQTVGASLSALEEKLPAVEAARGEGAVLRTVLLAEVDMLYDLFLSTSLPQYRKDMIGERVAAMRAALAADTSGTESHDGTGNGN